MNKTTIKLNVLLAKTDHLMHSFKNAITDYIQYFKKKQTDFKGEKKTYTPKDGTIDLPGERSNKLIVTTVDEKLDWLKAGQKEYVDALFSQEATNASGKARATLMVEGKSMGEYSSLELLRLKSLLENGELEEMYKNIPVRNDDEEWKPTTQEMYNGKPVFETELSKGTKKTTTKESYILQDPNIDKIKAGNYTPVVATKDTTSDLGEYSFQRFSGEWSHRQRAELLQRRTKLLSGVIEALKIANEIDAVESQMTSDKLFSYLHRGTLN